MKITSVNLNLSKKPDSKTLAFGSIQLENELVLTGVKVFQGKTGPFVKLAQFKNSKGEYRDVAFPTTAELRKAINEAILARYGEVSLMAKAA